MEYSQNNVLLFTLGHFGTDWAQGGIPALLPYFIAACHLSYQEAAGIIFANIVLASVTQPLIGYYSDRASLPYLVPLGVFLCGFSLSAMAFTQNYWFILFLAMLSGLGSSLFHPEAARLVNGISGAQKGKAMGTFSVGGNAGFAVGPMAAGFSAYQFGIKGLIIYAVVNFLTALFLMKKLPAIKKRLQGTEKGNALQTNLSRKMIGTPSGNLVLLFLHDQLALPSLTPLCRFTGSAFLAHQQAAAVLPFPCFFPWGLS